MTDFHFLRPLWFIALIALFLVIRLLKKYRLSQSGWQQLLPKHLANVLIDSKEKNHSFSLTIPFMIGLLSIIALAGPTWQKLPQPVYQLSRGTVLIMDMSYSMYATDISPNRLTRAKYKASDLLDNLHDGEVGLVAYAGDAFVISPLTEDINNITLLLPSLSPDLMPALGSNPLSALTLAKEMLINAGHIEGDIYWFTDGIDNEDIQDITEWSKEHAYHLNILGIGTTSGAPIKLTNGELMKDRNGAIIIPKLTESKLQGIAKRSSGNYMRLANDNSDINSLISQSLLLTDEDTNKKEKQSKNTGDQWLEVGPYLLLLILPLVLGYFRRGKIIALIPLFILLTPSETVHASIWQDLWKTDDQQGQDNFKKEAFGQAAEQFKNPLWQGSSYYKDGNFEQALESFKQSNTAESFYNQGNTLAQLQQLDEAIEAYDKALELNPELEDAKANKALLEQMKKQQEQQEKNNEKSDQENKDKQDDDEQQKSEQEQDESQENKDGQQSDNQDQQNSDQDSQQEQQENKDKSDKNDEKDPEQKSEEELEQEQKEQQAKEAKEQDGEQTDEEKQQAQKIAAQMAKEQEQKHQQLLNKVTDDPYLLLRNKMQLEYQKRRQNSSGPGEQKKW